MSLQDKCEYIKILDVMCQDPNTSQLPWDEKETDRESQQLNKTSTKRRYFQTVF